jgi:hypothetical protein
MKLRLIASAVNEGPANRGLSCLRLADPILKRRRSAEATDARFRPLAKSISGSFSALA